MRQRLACSLLALCAVLAFGPSSARALEENPPPPSLEELQGTTQGAKQETGEAEIRKQAMREAALSFGARGGLAHRTFQVRQRLTQNESTLSKTFDFRRLLISAPSGMMIEPPVVTEAQKALIIGEGGQSAAVADRIYSINQQAKIVTAPRDWRTYLERDWGQVEPPPELLLPKTPEERAAWSKWVGEGWQAGVQQADDIFQLDLDRLTRDFAGMVRYRELLAQNMISAPFANMDDRGVTGGGSEMRVGDRQITITGPSELETRADRWTPAPR